LAWDRGNKWERVILKISGEALADSNGFGIDNSKVQDVAEEIAVAVLMGVQVRLSVPR
jgi:uridylate kinase